MDISDELYKEILGCLSKLMDLNPERDSPAGMLFFKIAKAVSEYENNYFDFSEK